MAAPIAKPKWHRIYYLLAMFDVFVVSLGLYLTHQIISTFNDSVATNYVWEQRLDRYLELGEMAAEVNAPGNNVFDTHDAESESQRTQQALEVFSVRLEELKVDASRSLNSVQAAQLLSDLAAVDSAMQEMMGEAERIFSFFRQNEIELAGARMASMDRKYQTLNRALVEVRKSVTGIQRSLFAEQQATAARLQRFESLIALSVLVMIGAATLYGNKIRQQMETYEHERQGHIDELQAAELALQKANEQLEEKVNARTSELANANQSLQSEVAERTRTEEQLRQSESRFRMVVENLGEGLMISDFVGNALYTNSRWSELTGFTSAEVIGQPVYQWLLPPENWPQMQARNQARQAGEAEVYEQQIHRKDGNTFWAEIHDAPFRNANGERVGVISAFIDISERKASEQALAQRDELLRQSQKMEAVGRLAGGIAHDFNNLLATILAYCDLLLKNQTLDPLAHERVGEIKSSSEFGAALTQQLLMFSRKQVLQPQVFDLNWLVGDMEKLLIRVVGENIQLQCALHKQPCLLKADPTQLQQVLINLAINARDAMPDAGVLQIATATYALDANQVQRLGGTVPGNYVGLTVCDSGHGMDSETQKHIFEPFFTTKQFGNGTGLGLATVYGIVQQINGFITVKSAPQQGSTFTIYLPHEQSEQIHSVTQPTTGEPLHGTETILLVEDDESLREVLCDVLDEYGYRVLRAECPEHAIQLAQQYPAEIDLLITDVIMPKLNGLQVAERITASNSALRVLYMSGYTNDYISRHGLVAGDFGFIQKPFSIRELANKVRQMLDGRVVVSANNHSGRNEFRP